MAAATSKPDPRAAEDGVGVRQLADHLKVDPRDLRAFLRRTERAAGKGKRYHWPSLKSPEVKKIVSDWNAAQAEAAAEAEPEADNKS